jgi:O-antigen/teichoic acid export membrane protein
MVMIVLDLARSFGQVGLSQAFIQRKDSTREEFSSLHWLNVFVGAAAFLVLLAITPLAARIFGAPELGALIPVAALGLPISALGLE